MHVERSEIPCDGTEITHQIIGAAFEVWKVLGFCVVLCVSVAYIETPNEVFVKSKVIKKILILRPGSLGDLITTLPALKALRSHYPEAFIGVMGNTSYLEILKDGYYANKVSSCEQAEMASFFLKGAGFSQQMSDYFADFDVIISWTVDRNGVLTDNLRRVGVETVLAVEPLPPPQQRIHVTEHLLQTLQPLGIVEKKALPQVYLSAEEREFAARFLENSDLNFNQPLIALHPGSGSEKKRWPLAKFVEVANYAVSRWDVQILLISGPADHGVTEQVMAKIAKGRVIVGQGLTISQVAAVLERCSCYMGNDSGVTHLAAAVGVPTLAIFGPTDPLVWGPRGEDVKIIHKEVPCSPCRREEMNLCQKQQCLEIIEKKEVLTAVEKFLEGKQNSRGSQAGPVLGHN